MDINGDDYSDLVRSISGGILLKGVYHDNQSKNPSIRQTVTDVKGKIEIKSPSQIYEQHEIKFSNEQEMHEFESNLRDFGIAGAINCSGNIPQAGMELRASIKMEKRKQRDVLQYTSHESEINVIYTVVPTAVWECSLADFKLSRFAIEDLIHIEKSLSMLPGEVDKLCRKFFDKFGTHIIIGDVHFGGIKIRKTGIITKETGKRLKKNKATKFQSSVSGKCLSLFKTVDLGANLDINNSKPQEFHTLNKEKCVSNYIRKYHIGGPKNFQTDEEWQKVLSENKETWSVIYRDVTKEHNFEPIWKLILRENESFNNPKLLAHRIKQGTLPDSTIEFVVYEENYLKSKINILHSTLKEDKHENTSLKCIDLLLQMITDLNNKEVWRNTLQNYPPASEIMLFAIQNARTPQYKIALRRALTKIVHHSEGVEYKNKFKVTSWRLKVSEEKTDNLPDMEIFDIKGLIAWVEIDILKTAKLLPNFETEREQCITKAFCKAVSVLFSKVRQHNYQSDYILILAALIQFDFDYKEGSFRTQLTMVEIQKILKDLKKYLETYDELAKQSIILQHAWVLLLLVTEIIKVSNIDEKCISNLIEELQTKTLKLEDLVVETIKPCKGLKDIRSELQKLLEGDKENILCWNFFKGKSIIPYPDVLTAQKTHSNRTTPQEISNILQAMELLRYYPGKLTLQKVLEIDENTFQKPKCLKDIPFVILKKIISCNSKFRDEVLYNFYYSKSSKHISSIFESDEESPDVEDKIKESDNFHPLDVFHCIYLCCDPFLKCTLCKKIAEVQLAIPFVYPCENEKLMFSLWPLRKTFIGDQADTIARSPFHSVCFMRVGKVSFMSKSKLINEFMREQNVEHSTFFNAQCPLGIKHRKAYNGVIEMTCYIPSESNDDAKNAIQEERLKKEKDKKILILNLRGDVNEFPKQAELILQMSNIIVVLVEFSSLKDKKVVDTMKKFHECNVKVIMVTNNSTKLEFDRLKEYLENYKKNANVSGSKTLALLTSDPKTKEIKNTVTIRDELLRKVNCFLETTAQIILEDIANNVPPFVIVDELEGNCALGRREAESLILKIREQANGRLDKTIALPLQGKALWLEWSMQQKRLFNTEKSRSDDEVEQIMSSLLTIRKKQTDICNSESDIMGEFVKKILCCDENMERVMFFLSWFQEYLDIESKKVMPEKIDCVLNAYERLSSGSTTVYDVKQAEQELSIASFGLENFFREIGQIYECYSYCALEGGYFIETTTASVIQGLPKVVAKLLISGRPFEIMDGDAENIPVNWMKAVFKELEALVGNKKVFSISVIGVQSSGKSTLLNSMFGLEFPVRSGRCTRGVFLHVLPVNKRIACFDYAFVFDTEGLNFRAYGVETTERDNKLATLAIGLADVVIINNMGETIGENMKNILEIVIHALLRLKQANNHIELNQSCTFVHQNVSKTGKGIELKPDVRRLYQKLDEVTREVAIEENFSHIQSFKNVISFDVERDVFHIPHVLQGHPPMAPVSQKYSESVEKLAEHLFMRGMKKNCHLSITNTCDLLESVWKGILGENFVFSFRNCLEVKAYNLLESKFKGLVWEIEKMPQIFWNNKVRQTLQKCTKDNIDSEESSLISEFKKKIERAVHLGRDKLLKFIDKSELCDHMIHWKDRKLIDIIESSKIIEYKFENKIKQAFVHFKVRLKNDEMGSEEKIMQKVSDYAKGLKGETVSEENSRIKFQELWRESLNEVASMSPTVSHAKKQEELHKKMRSILYDQFHTHTYLLPKELIKFDGKCEFGQSDLFHDIQDIDESCINVKSKGIQNIFYGTFKDYKSRTITLTKEIYHRVSKYLNDLQNQDTECDETHFRHILNLVTFKEMDSKDCEFRITHLYQIKVAIRVAMFSFSKFSEMNRQYEEKHNLYSFLQSKKLQAEQVFFDILQEKADAEIVSNYLCGEFNRQIKINISTSMSLMVKEKMLECFSFTKSKMITQIMNELAEKENFDEYMQYITTPEVYVKKWIKEKTRCECFERKGKHFSYFVRMAEKSLSTDVSNITNYAQRTTENPSIKTLAAWIQSLCDGLDAFALYRGYAFLSSKYQVKDLESFCRKFTTQINEIESKLLETFKKEIPDEIECDFNAPYEDIFQFLWGCAEHCPLCLEPCQYTEEDHFRKDDVPHRCVQHRPFALGGNILLDSDELLIETCNYATRKNFNKRCGEWCNCQTKNYENKHPLRNYKTFMPSWDIKPSLDIDGSQYWCWFTATYIRHLALYFTAEPPQIPPRWRGISKRKALNSLNEKHFSLLCFSKKK